MSIKVYFVPKPLTCFQDLSFSLFFTRLLKFVVYNFLNFFLFLFIQILLLYHWLIVYIHWMRLVIIFHYHWRYFCNWSIRILCLFLTVWLLNNTLIKLIIFNCFENSIRYFVLILINILIINVSFWITILNVSWNNLNFSIVI